MSEQKSPALVVQLSVDELRAIIHAEVQAALGYAATPDRVMNVKQVAEMLGQSEDWVYRNWARIGGKKIGSKSIKFTSRAVERFLKAPKPI